MEQEIKNVVKNVEKVVTDTVKAPIHVATDVVHEAHELLYKDGELKPGSGMASGIFSLALGFLCFLAVLAFHYPQYLTTPELRHNYSVDVLRQILFGSLLLSGAWSLSNIVLNRSRNVNIAAFTFVVLATAWGGSRVPVGNFPTNTPYIGLDWFIFDLLGSTLIFVVIEKLFPLYKGQSLFRREWQTDLIHFAFNHFIVGLVLLITNFMLHHFVQFLVNSHFQQMVAHIAFIPQLLLCMLVADLIEYGTHRAYHEVPFLWRFHAVHHSVKTMDWLAGSRQHFCEILCTRLAVLTPIYILGFSQEVLAVYIIIIGFQAVFNHANVHLPWGPFKYIFVTPDFHHWHHASDEEAIDRNYAATFSFIDYLFGTAVPNIPNKKFPEKYGVVGDYMPAGFLKQQAFPFADMMKKKAPEEPIE